MKALVITVTDPFNPVHARRVVTVRRRCRLRALAPNTRLPYICLVNGQAVLRAGWRRRVRDGDVVSFIVLPQGGGRGGSNPLTVVLAIAVSVFAPYAGYWVAGQLGATLATGTLAHAMVGAISTMAGMALVNTLIPPPKPPSALQNQALAAPSPTYSLGAQGNTARIGQPIPVLYGRHVIYPDFAAQPYTEYAGNEQFLYQLFVLGQGLYDIEQIRLEDTVLVSSVIADGAVRSADGSFEEVQYQVIQPGGTVTLFPANVVTAAEVTGQELPGVRTGATYSQSGTTITVTLANHGLAVGKMVYLHFTSGTAVSGTYQVSGVPNTTTFTVTDTVSRTTSGGANVHVYVGPYVVNASGTQANALAFDMVAPRGLYYAENDGRLSQRSVSLAFIAQPINDAGAPIGPWTTLGTPTLTAATTTPQRQSYRYDVAAGRYQVMARRTDVKDTDTRAGHDIIWTGARAYLPGTQTYGNITLLALRMRATNQLSGIASRKINVIATRRLPIWTGSAWSAPTATRNPAWALADICRASYGLSLPDARIDLAALQSLAAVWDARGDTFDGIFDSQGTAWEALQQVAKVGRAFPFMQGGVITFARDAAATLPVALFSTRNIVRGSFRLDYLLPNEETADAVDVTYFDSQTWQERTVRAALPGSSESIVAKVKLFGCTSRTQAWREGMYLAACNRYRRRHVTFETEMEGLIISLGDLIAIQHDMPQWGAGGEVTAYDPVTRTITGTEPFVFTASGNHYIALRRPDGTVDGPHLVTPGANPYSVILASSPGFAPYTGTRAERTHYAFGPADAQYIRARVIAVRPKTLERVEITAVVESDYVHTADTGAPPAANAWQLPTRVTQPVVRGLIAVSDPDNPEKMFISWEPAPTAEYYQIEIRDSANTDPQAGWVRLAETRSTHFTAIAQFGNRTMLRVCAVGLTRGPWVEVHYGVAASYMWNANDATLMWSTDANTPMWRY